MNRRDGSTLQPRCNDLSGHPAASKAWYEKAASHTLDPALAVYARLDAIRDNKGDGAKNDYIQKNLNALMRMARKEIYAPYLDVIILCGCRNGTGKA
ncbi:MAG: hypothetical protein WDM78_17030 [Puia sp.]